MPPSAASSHITPPNLYKYISTFIIFISLYLGLFKMVPISFFFNRINSMT